MKLKLLRSKFVGLFSTTVTLFLLLNTAPSFAKEPCRGLVRPRDLAQAVQLASAVFVGTVAEITSKDGKVYRDQYIEAKVKTDRFWKGKIDNWHSVRSTKADDCQLVLEKNQQYIFFVSGKKPYKVNRVGWTRKTSEAIQLIDELGPPWFLESSKNEGGKVFPTMDGRIQCPKEARLENFLYADGSRAYFCKVENKEYKHVLSRIEVHANGNLKTKGQMKGGFRRVGEWSSFDEKGTLVKKTNYDDNGEEVCPEPSNDMSDTQTLIGYIKGDAYFPLVTVGIRELQPVSSSTKYDRMKEMHDVLNSDRITLKWEKISRDPHTDQCLHRATTQKRNDHSLYASKKISALRKPSAVEEKLFYSVVTKCVDQGDYPDPQPPCTKPTLIAVSDIDSNAKQEFWYSDPYKWDTGMTVAEIDPKSNELRTIAQDCSFCSD